MLAELKAKVLRANQELSKRKLAVYTWGNVSGIIREGGLVVIKPSGVAYDQLTLEKMVVLTLEGKVVEGQLRPSSDTPTHLELYRSFPGIGSIVHTHSSWATSWAQAGKAIPCLGTTHADHFYQEIPCTRLLSGEEIRGDYELNTGRVIAECFQGDGYLHTPAALVAGHGPFVWGKDPAEAIYNSVVLEEVARIAFHTVQLKGDFAAIPGELMDKHFWRKHGKDSYYGQKD